MQTRSKTLWLYIYKAIFLVATYIFNIYPGYLKYFKLWILLDQLGSIYIFNIYPGYLRYLKLWILLDQ